MTESHVIWPWALAIIVMLLIMSLAMAYGLYYQWLLIKKLNKECRRVNSVTVGIGQHLISIEHHLKQTTQFSQNTPQPEQDYVLDKARELFRTGSSVEEVSQHCGLSYAEASLISAMRQKVTTTSL